MTKSTGRETILRDSNNHEQIPKEGTAVAKFIDVWDFVWDIGKTLLFVVALAFVIRFYLVQPFYVEGQSMDPNFSDGEYLLIDELSYHFRDPIRGEVIVFKPHINTYQNYIKRVIASPGERVVFDGGVNIVKGESSKNTLLDESYLSAEVAKGTIGDNSTILLGNEFYVLGDNRFQSSDSRAFGPIAKKNIVGRVWLAIRTAPWRDVNILGKHIAIPRIVSIDKIIPPTYTIDDQSQLQEQ